MSQRLFTVPKVGVFLDTYAPGVEKRRGEEVSVVKLTVRVQPFDAKLATSLDNGVGGDSNIRSTVFSLNSPEPRPNFTGHEFVLGLARQDWTLYASPDTADSRLALTQVKVSGTYVRTQKDMNALAFIFKGTFGPVGRDELEYVHAWHRGQRFITFQESEHSLAFEEDGDGEDGEADDPLVDPPARPAPMFDTDMHGRPAGEGPAVASARVGRRRTRQGSRRKARGRR